MNRKNVEKNVKSILWEHGATGTFDEYNRLQNILKNGELKAAQQAMCEFFGIHTLDLLDCVYLYEVYAAIEDGLMITIKRQSGVSINQIN